MLSMFKEVNGQVSMRRVLAASFFAAFVVLSVLALPKASVGWYIFIPSLACVAASLLLLFFTTWADVAEVVSAAKK